MENNILQPSLLNEKGNIFKVDTQPLTIKKTKKVKTVKKKKCPKGKRRNPKTKRCRKSCKIGFRRNKKTHRCLKKTKKSA